MEGKVARIRTNRSGMDTVLFSASDLGSKDLAGMDANERFVVSEYESARRAAYPIYYLNRCMGGAANFTYLVTSFIYELADGTVNMYVPFDSQTDPYGYSPAEFGCHFRKNAKDKYADFVEIVDADSDWFQVSMMNGDDMWPVPYSELPVPMGPENGYWELVHRRLNTDYPRNLVKDLRKNASL